MGNIKIYETASDVTRPDTDSIYYFVDKSDKKLKTKDSKGLVTIVTTVPATVLT